MQTVMLINFLSNQPQNEFLFRLTIVLYTRKKNLESFAVRDRMAKPWPWSGDKLSYGGFYTEAHVTNSNKFVIASKQNLRTWLDNLYNCYCILLCCDWSINLTFIYNHSSGRSAMRSNSWSYTIIRGYGYFLCSSEGLVWSGSTRRKENLKCCREKSCKNDRI